MFLGVTDTDTWFYGFSSLEFERVNKVMITAVLGHENDCTGEALQQF
jgi:hypothetical protein